MKFAIGYIFHRVFLLVFLLWAFSINSTVLAASPTCGFDPWLNPATGNTYYTYCSVSAIGRTIVPDFGGCRFGEYCVQGGDVTVSTNTFNVQSCISSSGQTGIATGIGCVPVTPGGLVTKLFSIAMGIGGGIAFLMILIGSLQIQTSSGDPKRLQEGREIIEGAIIGLLLIILSVVILRIVGVNILAIPGFG